MSGHHPDDMVLLDYSAGSMATPQALAIAVHLSFCHSCRDQLKKLNSVGGVLLEEAKPASLDASSFDDLMSRIEAEPGSAAAPSITSAGTVRETYTNPLSRYLPKPLEDLPWRQQTREISKYDLNKVLQVRGVQVALQKIKAGARVPTHTHVGTELTVLLKGGFSDELGVYHVGDFVARDTRHEHSPTALQNEDCVCLTVLDAPLKFTGPFMRLLNPFMAWR